MQIEGTREAFKALLSQPGLAKKYNINKAIVSLFKSGKREPTLDKMEEILMKSGAEVVQEKVWELSGMSVRVIRHTLTGNIGEFVKEYKPTGGQLTTQIELSDGQEYYAPSHEFEEI